AEPSLDGYRRGGGPPDRPPAHPAAPAETQVVNRVGERSGQIVRPDVPDVPDRRAGWNGPGQPDRPDRPDRTGRRERRESPGHEVVLAEDHRPAVPRRRGRADEPDDRLPELAEPRRDLVLARPAAGALPERFVPDDDVDDEPAEAASAGDRAERSFLGAWTSFLMQILVAAAGGLAVWLGFQTLWRRWPYGAAVAAAAVLVVMLVTGHQIHRHRHPDEPPDMVTAGVLVIVGLVLTVSPVAFVLRPI
ncbi:MAG TPA: hypothetical protein VIR27_07765, partial [Mycobacteriales bacterium]